MSDTGRVRQLAGLYSCNLETWSVVGLYWAGLSLAAPCAGCWLAAFIQPVLLATERCLVARCFGSVAPRNRNRGRTPKFTELKTETETEDRKNLKFRCGSVRSSVFGENVPSLSCRSQKVMKLYS